MARFLKDYENYCELMTNLMKEFSSENLLFLTEAKQWRDELMKEIGGKDTKLEKTTSDSATDPKSALKLGSLGSRSASDAGQAAKDEENIEVFFSKIKLPFEKLPRSEALTNGHLSPFEQSLLLYKKYVKPYSPLESFVIFFFFVSFHFLFLLLCNAYFI